MILICIVFCCPISNNNFFSVCTCYGQQAKNIFALCGQSVSKEAKRMSPIKTNTVMEVTIQEPICSHKLDNRRLLNAFYSSTVCNWRAAWISLPHILNYQSKGRQWIVTLVFPEPPNALCTKCIGKVKNWKPIYSFNHQAPQEAWTGHSISVEQKPGEAVCTLPVTWKCLCPDSVNNHGINDPGGGA